jgi:hypothetical protein
MNLGFRHDICAETLENPAVLTRINASNAWQQLLLTITA